MDLYELNEAFSAQSIAVKEQLGLEPAKTNVNGGAVGLWATRSAPPARAFSLCCFTTWPGATPSAASPRSAWAAGMRWRWRWSDLAIDRA